MRETKYVILADVVESVDTRDLKSLSRLGSVGSSPSIGTIFVLLLLIFVLTGCTTPYNEHYEESRAYQYYVIDENSEIPDAYFKTKEEAESYKKYFKDNHNYIIVQLQ